MEKGQLFLSEVFTNCLYEELVQLWDFCRGIVTLDFDQKELASLVQFLHQQMFEALDLGIKVLCLRLVNLWASVSVPSNLPTYDR
jgi:hypothetical protein